MAVLYTAGGHRIENIADTRDVINDKIRCARNTADPVIEVDHQPENALRRGMMTVFHEHIVAVADR